MRIAALSFWLLRADLTDPAHDRGQAAARHIVGKPRGFALYASPEFLSLLGAVWECAECRIFSEEFSCRAFVKFFLVRSAAALRSFACLVRAFCATRTYWHFGATGPSHFVGRPSSTGCTFSWSLRLSRRASCESTRFNRQPQLKELGSTVRCPILLGYDRSAFPVCGGNHFRRCLVVHWIASADQNDPAGIKSLPQHLNRWGSSFESSGFRLDRS